MASMNTNYSRKTSQSGSIRAFGILLILIVGLLWAGAQKISTALANRKPTVLSYEEYAKTKPSAKWLVITNCQLNLLQACYMTYPGGSDLENCYYIPVRQQGSVTGEVSMILKTTDSKLISTVKQMQHLTTTEAAVEWVRKNPTQVFPSGPVHGLVLYGIDIKSTERDQLAHIDKNISEDFIILDSDAQPNLTAGISCSAAGLASLCGLVVYTRRKTAA
jgi:hypothetical protein